MTGIELLELKEGDANVIDEFNFDTQQETPSFGGCV